MHLSKEIRAIEPNGTQHIVSMTRSPANSEAMARLMNAMIDALTAQTPIRTDQQQEQAMSSRDDNQAMGQPTPEWCDHQARAAFDADMEQEIQAKGLTSPRLTPSDIDKVIAGETFTTLPSGKVMVCELTLRNGFTVRGEAAVVSKSNFNEAVGRKISRDNARSKVWELEGYLLQQRLHQLARYKA